MFIRFMLVGRRKDLLVFKYYQLNKIGQGFVKSDPE